MIRVLKGNQRGDTFERVTLLTEQTLGFDVDDDGTDLPTSCPIENAGCLGSGSTMVSLANMTTTDDIVGLSAG